jgi:hypothetical protein
VRVMMVGNTRWAAGPMTQSTVMWGEMISFPMGTSTFGPGWLPDGAKPATRRASGGADGHVGRDSSPKVPRDPRSTGPRS